MRSLLVVMALLFSGAVLAMHCPADMARIDSILQSSPPSDPVVLEQVKALREEGEALHNAGRHSESVKVLGKALQMLEASQ
ncbi:TMF family protein [Halopseudomonas phragmitis]|uniref:Uncharacterized protein n=2 Tax=Pseudomonadaceae TaxID=135621 RepID=A0A1V0B3L4_9GAMM|nr:MULTISPECIES: TMF family protein [Pseudomonadaceae]AQZ94529.1 hypothetical protein BVH74_07075 [Halopseudomonas phragmitis]RHW22266.1 hypothetical protein C2846_04380 [Pseudomonas jilinensis]